MGTAHFRSSVVAKAGTETITGFATISATALTGDLTGDVTGDITGSVTGTLIGDVIGNVTGNVTGDLTGDVTASTVGIAAGKYIKLGSTQYVLFGTLNVEASIVAEATALTATPQGSLYISDAGYLWIFDGAGTATQLTRN